MVDIPRFKRSRTITGETSTVLINPEIAGSPYGALSQTGAAISHSAEKIYDVDERARKKEEEAARVIKLSEVERDTKIRLDSYAERFRGREDFDKFEGDADTWMNELKAEMEPKVAGDREASAAFAVYFNRQTAEFKRLARMKKIDIMVKKGLEDFDAAYDEALQDYTTTQDPNRKAVIRNELEIRGQLGVQSGFFFGRDLAKKMKQFDKDVQEASITTALGSENTEYIESIIQNIDKGEYPDLKAKEREIYKNTLRNHMDRVKAKKENEDDKKTIDETYKHLSSIYGLGTTQAPRSTVTKSYQMMYDKLSDPTYLEEHKLTPQRKHQLEIILKQEEMYKLRKYEEVLKSRDLEAFDKWTKGTLTPTQINSWVQKEEMTDEKGKVYVSMLDARVKAGANVVTDESVFLKLTMAALEARTDVERNAVRGAVVSANSGVRPLLDAKSYEHLMSLTSPDNHPIFSNEYFRMAEKAMKQRLGWQEQLGFLKPEAGFVYTRALAQLINSCKEDKLTGVQIIKKAEEITLPYVQQFWKLLGMEPPKEKGVKEAPMGPIGVNKNKAPADVSSLMPSATSNKGKTIQDTLTGVWYRSDGKDWWEIE